MICFCTKALEDLKAMPPYMGIVCEVCGCSYQKVPAEMPRGGYFSPEVQQAHREWRKANGLPEQTPITGLLPPLQERAR